MGPSGGAEFWSIFDSILRVQNTHPRISKKLWATSSRIWDPWGPREHCHCQFLTIALPPPPPPSGAFGGGGNFIGAEGPPAPPPPKGIIRFGNTQNMAKGPHWPREGGRVTTLPPRGRKMVIGGRGKGPFVLFLPRPSAGETLESAHAR